REHLALASRQAAERAPDVQAELSIRARLLRRRVAAGVLRLVQLVARLPEHAPPARAPAVATGVDRDPGEPRSPGDASIVPPELPEEAQEDLLRDLLGVCGVREEEPTQALDASAVLAIDGAVARLHGRVGLHSRQVHRRTSAPARVDEARRRSVDRG